MPVAKTHEPDKRALAALLNRAKGDRTLKEFARLCSVNPSTLTRIMQQTNRGSSTLELITAIADNATPESGVTFDALLNANGYTRIYSPSSIIPGLSQVRWILYRGQRQNDGEASRAREKRTRHGHQELNI